MVIARTRTSASNSAIVADDETGEVSSNGVLARHGVIRDDFEEAIRAA